MSGTMGPSSETSLLQLATAHELPCCTSGHIAKDDGRRGLGHRSERGDEEKGCEELHSGGCFLVRWRLLHSSPGFYRSPASVDTPGPDAAAACSSPLGGCTWALPRLRVGGQVSPFSLQSRIVETGWGNALCLCGDTYCSSCLLTG